MRKHKIVSILWEDHAKVDRQPMISDPDAAFIPTLSVGIIYKETKKSYVLVQDIERYDERDDVTYLVIRKPILAIKEYGEVELERLREKGE